jgi:TatD DNase family protein
MMLKNKRINIHTHFINQDEFQILQLENNHIVNINFSYGIHPNAATLLPSKSQFFEYASLPHCLAIGEIGLDKTCGVDFELQSKAFETQALWAEELNLPVILHCVKAWNEMLALKKHINPQQAWIFHGFRKTTLLQSVLDAGVHISIGTAVLNDVKLQQSIPHIPLNRLFLETDFDERYTIVEVYECVSKLKNISLQDLENQVAENFKKTFHKWEIGSNVQNY